MTSFGWKRRVGNNVLREASKTFEANSKDVEDEVVDSDDVDWISLAAKRKCLQLEDAHTKSARLRLDGITLAEAERLQMICCHAVLDSFVFGICHQMAYFTLGMRGIPVS